MATLFTFLKQACHLNIYISVKDYIFGFTGAGWEGLNLILIELKKYIFYDWSEGSIEFHKIRFLNRIKRIIIKEKKFLISQNKFDVFATKWNKYTAIYDFRGPDISLI